MKKHYKYKILPLKWYSMIYLATSTFISFIVISFIAGTLTLTCFKRETGRERVPALLLLFHILHLSPQVRRAIAAPTWASALACNTWVGCKAGLPQLPPLNTYSPQKKTKGKQQPNKPVHSQVWTQAPRGELWMRQRRNSYRLPKVACSLLYYCGR